MRYTLRKSALPIATDLQ